ncbi:MAG TPA: CdaR family protein [Acidobacteriota bacterium]|nr:CdaR family protein [Acidobacteriota bacterium]HRR26968.1 CdaR family protein [Acidobacteriota bacterium]HRR55339.1 CdaR family protein [Acidobacteriota bacterium]HRV08847.1 CdaR family protein [Acidobacteriota bacterium]
MNADFVRGLFLDNLGLKLLSLALAFLLWVQIAGQEMVQRSVAVPVEFINMPPDLAITSDYPREVNVVISRPASLRMDERQLAAVIDLSGAEPGTVVVPLTEQNIRNVPSGARIEGIEQRRIRLQLESIRRKTVRVEPQIVGQPAPGYQIRQVRVVPPEVLISGPESQLEVTTMAQTEPIDVGGRIEGFRRRVYLDLEDPRLRIENTNLVEVFVEIEEERRNVRLRVPVRLISEVAGVTLSPRQVRLVVSVPKSYAQEVPAEGFYAYVGLPEEPAESRELELSLRGFVPEELRDVVRVEEIEPPTVKVRLP